MGLSAIMRPFTNELSRWAPLLAVLLASCEGDQPQAFRAPCTDPGTICTSLGNGDAAFVGEGALPWEVSLFWPTDLTFGPDGRPYIVDWQNHRIRRVEADGRVRVVIGTDEIGDGPRVEVGSEITAPGVPGTAVNLNHPTDVKFAPDGTLLLAAWHNHKLRHYDVGSGLMQVTCGRGPGYAGDGGPVEAALLNQPKALAVSRIGEVYVADTRNFRVRRIAGGVIESVVGTGTRGSGGDGGDPKAAGLSFQKGFDQPGGEGDNPEPGGGLALDAQGRLYIADTENQRIRRVDFERQIIETVAGNGQNGFSGDGGPATEAMLSYPRDVEVSDAGRLFIADTDNHRVRVVDLATGIITTVAGSGERGGGGDGGTAITAALNRPFGLTLGPGGDLFIADTLNNRIRRVVTP
jgi:hypothetical protein